MTLAADRIEVYEVLRRLKRRQPAEVVGWRFRFIHGGNTADAMLNSNGLYPDAAEARRVAALVNDQCFRGGYALPDPLCEEADDVGAHQADPAP